MMMETMMKMITFDFDVNVVNAKPCDVLVLKAGVG
jgi:hypothetical protein